ncbi:hypothetical protein BHE74_00041164 [Ensete ventricosum]|nr:hypothetical protein BHE74_00041164 [Ensete ventricosum]
MNALDALDLTGGAESSNTAFSHSRKVGACNSITHFRLKRSVLSLVQDMRKVRLDDSSSSPETQSRYFSNRAAASGELNGSDAQAKDAKGKTEIASGAAQIPSLVMSSLPAPQPANGQSMGRWLTSGCVRSRAVI